MPLAPQGCWRRATFSPWGSSKKETHVLDTYCVLGTLTSMLLLNLYDSAKEMFHRKGTLRFKVFVQGHTKGKPGFHPETTLAGEEEAREG